MVNEITYAIVGLIGGIILAIIGGLQKKASKRKLLLLIGLPLAGIGIVAMMGWIPQLAFLNGTINFPSIGQTSTVSIITPQNQNQITLCSQTDSVTVTLSAIDKYTSSAVGGTHRYRLNGAPSLTVADAGTFTGSPNQKLEVLWMNATGTSYFGKVDTYTIPCQATFTPNENGEPIKLVQNGSLTTRVWNEEGNLIDTTSENETLSNGDVVNLNMEVQGDYQRGYPYGFVLVVEYNKTTIDDVVISNGGVNLPSASVPVVFSSTLGGESSKKAFLFPESSSNAKWTGTVVIDADDTNNPLASGSDILFTYYPRNFFINEDNGGKFEGPSAEDEDSGATRTGSQSFTLQID